MVLRLNQQDCNMMWLKLKWRKKFDGYFGKMKKCYTFAPQLAGVAELVDAPDLGSGAKRRGGSSPFARTAKSNNRIALPDRLSKRFLLILATGNGYGRVNQRTHFVLISNNFKVG